MQDKYEMLKYAYEKVPFYQKLYSHDLVKGQEWDALPTIDRTYVSLHNDSMISRDYMGLYAIGKLISAHTSGSFGEQVDVYWSNEGNSRSLLPLWGKRWKTAKIHPRDMVCFLNVLLEDNQDYVIKKNSLVVSKRGLCSERIKHICDLLLAYHPKWLLLHPSAAQMLCDVVINNNLDLSFIQYIELTGEMFLESLKRRIEKVFCCTVMGHYGSMEVNSIGYECGKNEYELFDSTTFVEILDEDNKILPYGEEGYIHVTSLQNKAMPFIRYKLGDRGKLRMDSAGKRILQLSNAKETQFLVSGKGKLNAELLLEPLYVLSTESEKIIYQIQAEQVGADQIILRFYLDEEINRSEFAQYYMERLDQRVSNNFNILIYFVSKMEEPDKNTGKYKWFTSNQEAG